MKKEVKNQLRSKNFYLYLFRQIKDGRNPSQICKNLGITKQSLNYYLSSLKRSGFIGKIGYGTWEILKDFDEKEVKKSTRVAHTELVDSLKPDSSRGHGFQFKIKLPKIRDWGKRERIFGKKSIEFEPLKLGGVSCGQRIIFKGRKIWIANKHIIIYEKSSYFAETARESRSHALYDLIALIKSLEKLLGASFTIRGKYVFKVTRQHYSLVKNALAKQYDREGKKLQVHDLNGFWLCIDNSFNFQELETVHPKTAVTDNEKVQNYFNGIKKLEGFTPQFVVNSLAQNAQNLDNYAVHLKAHVESVKEMGRGTRELTKGVQELTRIIKELKNGN